VVKFIGDNYFKHEPYTTILNQMGVEVLHGPWYAQNIFKWLEDNAADIDYVFMNRPHITEKYIDFFKEHTDCRIIYYGHDLHFLRITREYELSGEEEKHLEAEEWKEKEMSIMHKADVIYYPSDVEAKLLKSIDNGINVKALVPYVYDEFKDYDRNSSKNNGILFVGGFAHTPNIDAVKWFVEHVYTKIRARADIPFYVVGSNPPEEITALDGDGVVIRGFVSDEELEELYNSCKLVVVPLRYGAGVKGKVVEAIYNGVPIVTTSVGAEGIPNCEDVLVIKDDVDEFADAVVRLYSDDKMLDELSKKMQAYIKKYNSVEAAWSIVGSDFQ
jgi:glycosyltransferase involved in cell wall biosynthesis